MEAVLRHDGSSDSLTGSGRLGILTDMVTALAPAAASELDDVARCIFPEFDSYGELIAAIDSPVAGLLVRGEGQDFTRRVSELMESWHMTEEAKRFQLILAEAFNHKRAFLKLEWCALGDRIERQIAVYYRRRPSVHDALKMLAGFAGSCLPLGEFRELGALLGKDTVHFVAFTARPDRPLWYKFYFSQYLTPESFQAGEARLRRAVERFAAAPTAVPRWLAYHDRLAPRYRAQSVFVSLALCEDGSDGSIKIDYPDVAPMVAAGLIDGAVAAQTHERLRCLCDAAGRDTLSYLGVRIGAADHLVLKGYADFL